MNLWARIGICVVLSLVVHGALDAVLSTLPPLPAPSARPSRVTMTVYEPTPSPTVAVVTPQPVEVPTEVPVVVLAPEPAVAPPPPRPSAKRPDKGPTATPSVTPAPALKPSPDPMPSAASGPEGAAPIVLKGLTIESSSEASKGAPKPIAHHAGGGAHEPGDAPRPSGAVTPTHEVSKMPAIQGTCRGKYTDAARDLGIEGTVVLDLVVGADGSARDIKVTKGLGHGLDEAAIAALARCRFKPGTRGDAAVAVQLRAFKVRFFLDDSF